MAVAWQLDAGPDILCQKTASRILSMYQRRLCAMQAQDVACESVPDTMHEEQLQFPDSEQPYNASVREQAAATVHAIFKGSAALPRSIPVRGIWQEHARQQQAFDYIDHQPPAAGKQLRVYSQEYGARGQRNYIVGSSDKLWEAYADMDPLHRHLYEIIREGRPCHLYFDLEYDQQSNPCIDGDAQVMLLVQEVVSLMKERLGVSVVAERDVVELDSTTPTKFSRHVIIQLRRAWAHVGHVHAFVSLLLNRLLSKRQQEAAAAAGRRGEGGSTGVHPDQVQHSTRVHGSASAQPQAPGAKYAHFWVRKPTSQGHEETTLIDTAVYTRNRAFRLYLSSKFGKTQQLCATRGFLVGHLLATCKDIVKPAPMPSGSSNNAASAGTHLTAVVATADVAGSHHHGFPNRPPDCRDHQQDQCTTALQRPKKISRTGQHAHLSLGGKSHETPSLFTLIASTTDHGATSPGDTTANQAAATTAVAQQQQNSNAQHRQHVNTANSKRPAIGRVASSYAADAGQQDDVPVATARHTAASSEGGCSHRLQRSSDPACSKGLVLTKGEEACVSQQVLWASLVTHTMKCEGVKLLTMFKENEADQHRGVVRLPGQAASHHTAASTHAAASSPCDVMCVHHASMSAGSKMTTGLTPWAGLNTFVEHICAQVHPSSRLPTLMLSIRGNRWCDNIQRAHRSNGIFLMVDVQEGVWTQGCCDPECRGFRSPAMPLPQDVWQQLQQHFAGDVHAADVQQFHVHEVQAQMQQ